MPDPITTDSETATPPRSGGATLRGAGAQPGRADARRNRERLIEAARERFARDGTDVSLADIAREAGVGVGTVYRHFPAHGDLVEAVYRDEVARLCERGAALLREQDPSAAVGALLEAGVAAGRVRDDVGPEEALAAMGAIYNLPDGDPAQARRVLRIVVDGLLRH